MWYNEKNKWKVGGFLLFAIATITLIQFVSNKDEPKKIISENRKLAIIHVHVIPIAIILTPCQVQKPMRMCRLRWTKAVCRSVAAWEKLYKEFGIAFSYGELATDPNCPFI